MVDDIHASNASSLIDKILCKPLNLINVHILLNVAEMEKYKLGQYSV